MGADLVGGALVSFVLAELRPVISRHPRFRGNAGTTLAGYSNLITYNDLSLTVTNIRGEGNQQSPDAFVTTLMGRAVHARLQDKPGAFIEWVREYDPSGAAPDAGIYYFEVDSVSEATRDVRLVLERYRWLEGSATGEGTTIRVAHPLQVSDITSQDPAVEMRVVGDHLILLSYVEDLTLLHRGVVLTPGVDWWLEGNESHTLVGSTPGGAMSGIPLPSGWSSLSIMDQDDFALRQGVDWGLEPTGTSIWLAAWIPQGATIRAQGSWRRIPGPGVSIVDPENLLGVTVPQGETLAQGFYSLIRGDFGIEDVTVTPTGQLVLKHLMEPGDRLRWELRTRFPQVYIPAKKLALNPGLVPGLSVAVGDLVEVGDAAALLVFPQRCETYAVFGAKDSVSFDIIIKSNDLTTTSELASLVKDYLVVDGRDHLEAAGLSVQRVSPSYQGDARDASGTASTHSVTLSVSGLADWEVHRPLINRVDDIDVSGIQTATYPRGLKVSDRAVAFGLPRFYPAYQ